MSPAGTTTLLEQQYAELHQFVTNSVEDVRDDLLLVEFLALLSVYFSLDDPELRDRLFDTYQGYHYEHFPYEIDAMSFGRSDIIRQFLFSNSGTPFKVEISKTAKEYLNHFLSLRSELRVCLEKAVQVGASSSYLPANHKLALIRDVEHLMKAEAGIDDRRTGKIQEMKWAVSRRMRMYALNELGPATTALLDSFVYTPESEPPSETFFFAEYVEKLLPPQPPPSANADAAKRMKTGENGKRMDQSGETLKWPSIAMASFLDSTNALISVGSSSHDHGKCIVGGFEDGTARVFTSSAASNTGEDKSGLGTHSHLLVGHSEPVFGVSVHDGRVLTCSGDGQVRLWTASAIASPVYENLMIYPSTPSSLASAPLYSVAYGPFGHIFACGGRGGLVKMFSIENDSPVRVFTGHHLDDVNCVTFHPNSHFIVSGSADRTVRVWDVREGKPVRTMVGMGSAVESLCCDPSGRYLAAGGQDGSLSVVDIAMNQRIRYMSPAAHQSTQSGAGDAVYSLSWSQDGKFLAQTDANSIVKLWSMSELLMKGGDMPPTQGLQAEDADEWLSKSFRTKCSPVIHLNFIKHDVLLACGIADLAL